MSILKTAKKRYSVRNYKEQPIEEETLNQILEAAHVAPTAANLQPVRLLVVKSKEAREKLSLAANIYNAPVCVIVCADSSAAWERPFDGKTTEDIDASILTDHMMLTAAELGIGSVWICYFKPDVVKEQFQLPDNLVPINILALGYPADSQAADCNRHNTQRIPMNTLVQYF